MLTSAMGTCTYSGSAVGATVAAALQFFAVSHCLISEQWPPQADVVDGSSFDFIIIGAGTAGSTLAARLSEMQNFKVLLVEAGGDPPQETIIPGFKDSLKGSPYDWKFSTINDSFSSQALIDGSQHQPRGKMLGGSGSLNDMVYARGFPIDYDEWAVILGDESWNWTTVLECFKKTEHLTDEKIINDPELMKYHGQGGEIEVAGLIESTRTTDIFLNAFRELGFNIVKDMTNPDRIGAGRFSHTIRDGKRDSSLTALLNKAAGRDNLFVLKDALVTKILIENNTAYGVKVLVDQNELQLFANKEVIVSAGTFNTAKLLLLSGIGPRDHLEDLDIELVQNLPVGDNLHDHVMVLTYLAAENGTCYTAQSTSYMEMVRYLYDQTGSFSRTNSMGAYMTYGSPEPNVPEFAIYPTCIPIAAGFYNGCTNVLGFNEEICNKLEAVNENYELLSLAVVRLKPKSRGNVRLNSGDPLDKPLIYSGTFSDSDDLEWYSEAVKKAWALAETSYFSGKGAHVVDISVSECDELEESEELTCKIRAMATSAWHAVGTAAMGSVVDSRLRVFGVSGLRVVDASVMPKVIRGNTNAPVVMIAERAADFIKDDYGDFNRGF